MDLIANLLYNEMLGSLPNFNTGSAVAITMLLPSVVSILLLSYLERYNIRYNKISEIDLEKNRGRDVFCGILSGIVLLAVLSVFAVIFVVPFVDQWPYRLTPTLEHVKKVFSDDALMGVFKNSLLVAVLTAAFGTLVVYGSALISARKGLDRRFGRLLNRICPGD